MKFSEQLRIFKSKEHL